MAEPGDIRELLRLLLTRNQQLQTALDTRIAIEQAKGILAERLHIPLQEAFLVLRAAARRNRMKIRDLAQRALSFLAVGAVLLLGGFFYQRLSAQYDERIA